MMKEEVRIGDFNTLTATRESANGLYLDGGPWGEILLPQRYVAKDMYPGSKIDVFLYTDSEDRLVATTEKPKARVGEFACLEVVNVTPIGAFLNWGLAKDLLMPLGEQKREVRPGERCVVAVFLDLNTHRVAASARLSGFICKDAPSYKKGDKVSLLICNKTELGYRAIVDHSYWGVLFSSDVFEPLEVGAVKQGFIKRVRKDGKIDLLLHKPGYKKVKDFTDTVLEKLEEEGGFLALNDKTDPETIYEVFGVSKKTFKQAVGALYKQRKISVDDEGIRRLPEDA